MAEDADSRTEAPTPRRLERAARDGEVWQPRELAPALSVVLLAGGLAAAGAAAWQGLAAATADALAAGPGKAATGSDANLHWGRGPLLLVVAVAATAALLHVAAGVVVARGWSSARLAPKLSRLSPVAGIKRLFSREGLTTALLALAKFAAFGAAAVLLFAADLPGLLRLDGGIDAVGPAIAAAVFRLATAAAAGLVLIAAIEGATSFRAFRARLRMSKDEVRREQRESNGSPEVKAAIRRSQLAAASRRLRTVLADATVIVVNPTHFAIALRYRIGEDSAPVLLEKGRDVTAEAIVGVARELGLAVVRAPRLARAVFFTGRIGEAVREELFGAVAIVIAYVLSFDGAAAGAGDADLPTIAVPSAFDFDAGGARRKPGVPGPL